MRSEDERVRALIAQQAAEWHVAHSEGGLSPSQSRAFMHWLRASPVHVAEYFIVAGIARDAADAARTSTASLKDLLAAEADSIRPLPSSDGAPGHAIHSTAARTHSRRYGRGRSVRQSRRGFSRSLAVTAAMVVMLAVTAFAALYWFAPSPHIERFATEHGQELSVRLPDQTLVRLDSETAIAIHYDKDHRRVEVESGQAYFKVADDPRRPFSVRAGNVLIRHIGTVFDVYRRPSGTTITVAEGRVEVWDAPAGVERNTARWSRWLERTQAPSARPLVTLDAGEQVVLNTSGQITSYGPADLDQALAWISGKIIFDGRSMASVAAEFNRYNDAQIIIGDSRIAQLPISGTFKAHDVATFVSFLDTLPAVHVKWDGQRVLVDSSRKQAREKHP